MFIQIRKNFVRIKLWRRTKLQIKGIEKGFCLHGNVRRTITTIENGRYMTGKTDDASTRRMGIVGLLWEVRRAFTQKNCWHEDYYIVYPKNSSRCIYYSLAAHRAFGPLLLASGMACKGLIKVSCLMQIANKSKKCCIWFPKFGSGIQMFLWLVVWTLITF